MESKISAAKSERNYGIDLLRIVAMLLVLLRHILGTNDFLGNNAINGGENAINEMIAWFMETVAYICVNLYALISGYVGYGRKIRYGNIMHLCLSVMFYTIPFTCFLSFVLKVPTSAKTWFSACFPMISGYYWYFIAYFALFFFTPFLNILMEKLERRNAKVLLCSIIFVFSFIPTFLFSDPATLKYGYTMLWLAALYIIGAYLKKYSVAPSIKKCLLIFSACIIGTYGFKYIVAFLTKALFGTARFSMIFYNYTSPTIVLAAVMLLLLFSQLKFNKPMKKIISIAAPLAFSVYIIHYDGYIMKHFIVGKFAGLITLNPILFTLSILGITVLIYIICSVIDLLRFYLFKLLKVKDFCYKIEDFIAKKASRFLE